MEANFKKPYEISLWDDDLTFVYQDGATSVGKIEGGHGSVVAQYYKERKICVIGSNTMNTPIRAMNGKLISNINGSNTLTFSIYSKYWDEDDEQFYDNPFLKLLVNERKIKLRHGDPKTGDYKWYDLIIKNIQENSETKTFTYTAKDLFINELSKSGFDLVLDPELENNMGTITELADNILEGSDWQRGKDNDILIQTKEEPLYEIILTEQITASSMESDDEIIIGPGQKIYGFHSIIANEEPYFQFLYVSDGKYECDDDYVITNSKNWHITSEFSYSKGIPTFTAAVNFCSSYRGKRIVRQIQTFYDSTIDKYVQSYNNGEIYGYSETEYVTSTSIENLSTNPNCFTSTSGWKGINTSDTSDQPVLRTHTDGERCFLKFNPTKSGQRLFNSGINDKKKNLTGFSKDEKYVFQIKYAKLSNGQYTYQKEFPKITVGCYTITNGVYNINNTLFNLEKKTSVEAVDNVCEIILSCKAALSKEELSKNNIGVFINFGYDLTRYIEDFQIFKYETDEDGKMIVPGGDITSTVKTKYYYYTPSKEYKSIEDVKYVYQGYEQMYVNNGDYNDSGSNKYEKVRSIQAKESNRFNLIQTLCETFECWPKFTIYHKENGEIELDENYRQKKFITFHKYIGKENQAGFKYGINLKSIQRTLDSNGSISKIIVKDNANQFAKNGSCSITRAKENPCGENFIYDFSYYIQHGLLEFTEISNDLYLNTAGSGYLNYYNKLRELNKNRDKWTEKIAGLQLDLSKLQSSYQTYKISVDSAEENRLDVLLDIYNLTGFEYDELNEIYKTAISKEESELSQNEKRVKDWFERESLTSKLSKITQYNNTIARHTILRDQAELNINTVSKEISDLEENYEDLITQKRALNLQFYKKYSRFIQEGSWIKEDYLDDDLYYLDAASTLHTSSQPKVTYNINVLELSGMEEYKNYNFNLGDKTYMEDTEFFGWTWKNGIKTPYHEEIVVTEFTVVLDSPEQNTIKVQNYKTQFEDLFQRITATTQSVEYHTGEYNRAATVVEADGTIAVDVLQNSMINNAIRLENAKDQSVVMDENGITTTSLNSPNEVLRLISGGVFLSSDGGATWSTGISGNGINANYITSGRLDTNVINIMNNGQPSFKWDGAGISAYEFSINENNGKPTSFNIAKFVRFDRFGIYGINGISQFTPSNEDSIWQNAKYALTWKGFMLKNDDGSVQITSENDIQVIEGGKERIKIGRITKSDNENVYGIRISDKNGNSVMETDDQGELWLRKKLSVQTTDSNKSVQIGYLDKSNENGAHEVINANGAFKVYEDGSMVGTKAHFSGGSSFEGHIVATSGKIGNLDIASIKHMNYKVEITCDKGYTVQNNTEITLTARLFDGTTEITEGLGYQWYNSNGLIEGKKDKTCTIQTSFNPDFGYAQYSCEVTIEGED